MTAAQSEAICAALADEAPGVYTQALAAAGAAMKARPAYLKKQTPERRAQAIRRALARVVAADLAEQVLAAYYLECRKELLLDWLDTLGLEHDDGSLSESAPAEPEAAALRKAVEAFRGGDDPADRELLLRAFAAQSAIDWPGLEALLADA